jgi:hypothetical protein
LSIEETHKTDELGRYIFIVYKQDFEAAQVLIGNFCKEVFPKIYFTQDKQDTYRVTYQSLPHLVDSPSAGGAVRANGKHLDHILIEAETARGKPFAIGSSTWADRVAPRMIFDQSSELQVTKTRKQAKNKTNDDASVITTNSSSTVNNSSTAGASKTVASAAQTFVSQEFSVALSDMKSMMSGMFDRQDAFVRQAAKEAKEAAQEAKQEAKEAAKEAKETALAAAKASKAEAQEAREAAREAAKEAKEAAAEAKRDAKEAAADMREFLQTMMKMMLEGRVPHSSTPKRKLEEVRTIRKSIEQQRKNSTMWQHANRDRSQEEPPEHYEFMEELETVYASIGDDNQEEYDSFDSRDMDDKDEMTVDDVVDSTGATRKPKASIKKSPDSPTNIGTTPANATPPPKKPNNRKSPSKPPSHVAFTSKDNTTSTKITKTGRAPTKPTTARAIAVSLDFEAAAAAQNADKLSAIPEAPDPDADPEGHQE